MLPAALAGAAAPDASGHRCVFSVRRAVLLAFSRDTSISGAAAVPPAPLLTATAKDGRQLHPYPPSGVLPFQGLACYLAPLCHCLQHPAAVYRLFRALYCRHWCALHSLSAARAPAAALPVLCRTFAELLQVRQGLQVGRSSSQLSAGRASAHTACTRTHACRSSIRSCTRTWAA